MKFRNHVDECHLELHLPLVVSGAGLDLLDPFMRTCGGMIYRNPRFSGVRVPKHSDREAPRERKIKIDVD